MKWELWRKGNRRWDRRDGAVVNALLGPLPAESILSWPGKEHRRAQHPSQKSLVLFALHALMNRFVSLCLLYLEKYKDIFNSYTFVKMVEMSSAFKHCWDGQRAPQSHLDLQIYEYCDKNASGGGTPALLCYHQFTDMSKASSYSSQEKLSPIQWAWWGDQHLWTNFSSKWLLEPVQLLFF